MSSQTYLPLPYVVKLEGSMNAGECILIKGFTKGERFDVNLSVGSNILKYCGDDIGFHMRWRKDQAIILNCFEKRKWKNEQRIDGNVIKHSRPFDLRIRCHENRFEIFVDRKKLADFDQRIKSGNLCYVGILGDICLESVAWEGKKNTIPFRGGIPGNFIVGKRLFVSGLINKAASGFTIDLFADKDTALHFDVQLKKQIVSRNYCIDGKWGKEEISGTMPFVQDTIFDMEITSEENAIKIFVNGQEHSVFQHRVLCQKIDSFELTGGIDLHCIGFVRSGPGTVVTATELTAPATSPRIRKMLASPIVKIMHAKVKDGTDRLATDKPGTSGSG